MKQDYYERFRFQGHAVRTIHVDKRHNEPNESRGNPRQGGKGANGK